MAVQQAGGDQVIHVINGKQWLALIDGDSGFLWPSVRLRLQAPDKAYAITSRDFFLSEEETDNYPYVNIFCDTDGDGLPDYKDITLGRYHLAEAEWEKIGDASAPDPEPDSFPERKPPLEIYRPKKADGQQ